MILARDFLDLLKQRPILWTSGEISYILAQLYQLLIRNEFTVHELFLSSNQL